MRSGSIGNKIVNLSVIDSKSVLFHNIQINKHYNQPLPILTEEPKLWPSSCATVIKETAWPTYLPKFIRDTMEVLRFLLYPPTACLFWQTPPGAPE